MSLGHLVVIFILRHHWQSEIDCRGGNECISKFDGSMYAIAATIENEAGPSRHDGLADGQWNNRTSQCQGSSPLPSRRVVRSNQDTKFKFANCHH